MSLEARRKAALECIPSVRPFRLRTWLWLLLVGATLACAPGGRAEQKLWLRVVRQARLDSVAANAIAVDPYGRVYLCDRSRNQVFLLNEKLSVVRFTGGFGWDKEQFDLPIDICARNGLDIFVCDYHNNRVQRYDKDLNFLATMSGEELDEPWRFAYPVSVDQASQGDLFLLQREPPRVIRFDALGIPRFVFGELESGEGKLVDPVKLEVGGDDRIYVLDAGVVKVFDFFGNFAGSYVPGQLPDPTSLACGATGTVLVAGSSGHIVALRNGGLIDVDVVPAIKGEVVDLAVRGREVYILLGGEGCEIWVGELAVTAQE